MNQQLPTRCIDCFHYSKFPVEGYKNNELGPVIFGSCDVAIKNFVSIDPFNQIPSWCPKKKEKMK